MTLLSRRAVLDRALLAGALAATVSLAACVPPPPPGPPRDVAVIRMAPPPPRYEPVPVLPPDRASMEYWQAGHWRWNGREYAWVPGRYERRPRPGAVWVEPRYERHGEGWVFVEGRWR